MYKSPWLISYLPKETRRRKLDTLIRRTLRKVFNSGGRIRKEYEDLEKEFPIDRETQCNRINLGDYIESKGNYYKIIINDLSEAYKSFTEEGYTPNFSEDCPEGVEDIKNKEGLRDRIDSLWKEFNSDKRKIKSGMLTRNYLEYQLFDVTIRKIERYFHELCKKTGTIVRG